MRPRNWRQNSQNLEKSEKYKKYLKIFSSQENCPNYQMNKASFTPILYPAAKKSAGVFIIQPYGWQPQRSSVECRILSFILGSPFW
jgi:hypothetical protein